jgi:serine protease Do
VSDVRPGSPAEKAGLKSGDVIVEFNGKEVDNPHRLQNLVERAPMSGEQTVVVMRGEEKVTVPVSLAPLPADAAKSETAPAKPETKVESLGLEVSDLTADVAEQLGFKDATGVVITSVASGSKAEMAGLESGMVIARVGSKDVQTAEDFKTAVEGSHDNGLLMLVRTPQGSQFVVVK